MFDRYINKNVYHLSQDSEYEYYEDFMEHNELFVQIKNNTYPYKMHLIGFMNYDYRQRMVILFSSHNKFYLLDAGVGHNNMCDKVLLLCNSYNTMKEALDDMNILVDEYDQNCYIAPKETLNNPFTFELQGTTFMHGDDIMNGLFTPYFHITCEKQADPFHSYILECNPDLYIGNNAIGYENFEKFKAAVLPLDEKINENEKLTAKDMIKFLKKTIKDDLSR